MQITGSGRDTYLYLQGLGVEHSIRLGEHVELRPARCEPNPDTIIALCKSEIDIGVAAIFLRQVTSQLHVTAKGPKQLAERAWNALWNAVLMSALYDRDVVCNFQCDTPAQELSTASHMEITNYHLRGLSPLPPRILGEEDIKWIESHVEAAWSLLDADSFQTAVHALASYRWNPHPRVRLAVLWSGVEGLFGIESELAFRLRLYIARFLEPQDEDKRRLLFANVRRLYSERSRAVHGSIMKDSVGGAIEESAQLLRDLVRTCIINGALPCAGALAP